MGQEGGGAEAMQPRALASGATAPLKNTLDCGASRPAAAGALAVAPRQKPALELRGPVHGRPEGGAQRFGGPVLRGAALLLRGLALEAMLLYGSGVEGEFHAAHAALGDAQLVQRPLPVLERGLRLLAFPACGQLPDG